MLYWKSQFKIGDIKREGSIKQGEQQCVIQNVKLPKGPVRLESWLLAADEKYGAYNIELEYME